MCSAEGLTGLDCGLNFRVLAQSGPLRQPKVLCMFARAFSSSVWFLLDNAKCASAHPSCLGALQSPAAPSAGDQAAPASPALGQPSRPAAPLGAQHAAAGSAYPSPELSPSPSPKQAARLPAKRTAREDSAPEPGRGRGAGGKRARGGQARSHKPRTPPGPTGAQGISAGLAPAIAASVEAEWSD